MQDVIKSFAEYQQALEWGFKNGRDNCLPCHEWRVEGADRDYRIAIRYRASGDLVGYAS